MKSTQLFIGALLVLLVTAGELGAACTAPGCTKIIDNGPDSGKKVLVVMGDGYAAADQTKYNNDVQSLVVGGVFGNDFFLEQQNAFNVYRLNLVSAQSGVSLKVYDEKGTPKDKSDDTVSSTTTKNTSLKMIFSGSWAHCWMEYSSQTESLILSALNANVPNYDYVLVIMNHDGFGGCGGGGRQHVTRGVAWPVVAHEYGHGIGALWDEYAGAGAYTGDASNTRNCSTVVNKSTVFWNRFINPSTPVPTTFGPGLDGNRTVGIYQGCGTRDTGIYRPVNNCRMRGNTPNYCPVCQMLMRKALYPNLTHDFDDAVVGDFNGDGRSDVLVHNGNDIAIYRSTAGPNRLELTWMANNRVPSAPGSSYFWTLAAGDRFYVADFDGDGKDDVFVFNGTSWNHTWLGMLRSDGNGLRTVRHFGDKIGGYWTLKAADQFFIADFNGDKKDDLFIFNGKTWSQPYLLMAQSTGTSLAHAERYDGSIPGWIMARDDKYYPGDFDGNGQTDLYVFNGLNWSSRYFGMLKSSGAGLSDIKLYTNTLASGWKMGKNDQHYVGDTDGDGKADVYVFNGKDWAYAYLELTKSTGTALNFIKRYDNNNASAATNIPGWLMTKGDRHFVSDANKDGKADLFVFNTGSWSTEYLGTLMSTGAALSGTWSENWVGGWNLGAVDKILVANYEGGAGKADVFIRNKEWFGLLRRAASGFVMDRIYYHWLYNPLYDSKPWSDSLP